MAKLELRRRSTKFSDVIETLHSDGSLTRDKGLREGGETLPTTDEDIYDLLTLQKETMVPDEDINGSVAFRHALDQGIFLPQVFHDGDSKEFCCLQFQQFHLMYSYVYIIVFFGTCFAFDASLGHVCKQVDGFNFYAKHILGVLLTTLLYLLVGVVFTLFLFLVDRHLDKNYNPWVPRRKLPHANKMYLSDLTKQSETENPFGLIGIAQGFLVYVTIQFGASNVSWTQSLVHYLLARPIQAIIIDAVFYAIHYLTHTNRFYYLHKAHHTIKYVNIFTSFEQTTLDALLESFVTLGISDIILLCGSFHINRFWVVVMQLWPLYASVAVHLPYEVHLFSRWSDFCPVLDMLLGMDSATMDHIGHHYIGSCNYGAFGIVDRILATHISLMETYDTWKTSSYRGISIKRRAEGKEFPW